jgi:hypothetical protein
MSRPVPRCLEPEARCYLGRATTSLNSALHDLSFGEIKKGVPDEDAARSLLAGTAANRLDQVSPFGVNSDLGSLDEQMLFEAVGDQGDSPSRLRKNSAFGENRPEVSSKPEIRSS